VSKLVDMGRVKELDLIHHSGITYRIRGYVLEKLEEVLIRDQKVMQVQARAKMIERKFHKLFSDV
jgi:Tfp pilus assembly PilM family ATPase